MEQIFRYISAKHCWILLSNHMVADVPVGAFLSAGIDSGALVGLMSELK